MKVVNSKFCFRRSLKIVAESYAVKGLCLQKEPSATSKYKKAEKEEEMSKCFDLSSDLALLYMQKLEREQTNVISIAGKSYVVNGLFYFLMLIITEA